MPEPVLQMMQQFFIFPFFFILVFGIIWFVAGILICIWVYQDAKSRGMDGALWLLIVLIANVLGLIIYLIIREEKRPVYRVPPYHEKQARFCSNCGSELTQDAKFCSKCGKAAS
ncbi:zinc ribbon domain-containing protein [Candidatus Bathyarchaeota archaeon]|nr:zinc ribbon domain-containing protein [Candidatus Bathyarchaeota archaeon]